MGTLPAAPAAIDFQAVGATPTTGTTRVHSLPISWCYPAAGASWLRSEGGMFVFTEENQRRGGLWHFRAACFNGVMLYGGAYEGIYGRFRGLGEASITRTNTWALSQAQADDGSFAGYDYSAQTSNASRVNCNVQGDAVGIKIHRRTSADAGAILVVLDGSTTLANCPGVTRCTGSEAWFGATVTRSTGAYTVAVGDTVVECSAFSANLDQDVLLHEFTLGSDAVHTLELVKIGVYPTYVTKIIGIFDSSPSYGAIGSLVTRYVPQTYGPTTNTPILFRAYAKVDCVGIGTAGIGSGLDFPVQIPGLMETMYDTGSIQSFGDGGHIYATTGLPPQAVDHAHAVFYGIAGTGVNGITQNVLSVKANDGIYASNNDTLVIFRTAGIQILDVSSGGGTASLTMSGNLSAITQNQQTIRRACARVNANTSASNTFDFDRGTHGAAIGDVIWILREGAVAGIADTITDLSGNTATTTNAHSMNAGDAVIRWCTKDWPHGFYEDNRPMILAPGAWGIPTQSLIYKQSAVTTHPDSMTTLNVAGAVGDTTVSLTSYTIGIGDLIVLHDTKTDTGALIGHGACIRRITGAPTGSVYPIDKALPKALQNGGMAGRGVYVRDEQWSWHVGGDHQMIGWAAPRELHPKLKIRTMYEALAQCCGTVKAAGGGISSMSAPATTLVAISHDQVQTVQVNPGPAGTTQSDTLLSWPTSFAWVSRSTPSAYFMTCLKPGAAAGATYGGGYKFVRQIQATNPQLPNTGKAYFAGMDQAATGGKTAVDGQWSMSHSVGFSIRRDPKLVSLAIS